MTAQPRPSRTTTTVLLVAYLVAVLALVLTPISWALNRLTVRLYVLWTDRLHGGWQLRPEHFGYVLNVLLFAPVGALTVLGTRLSWWASALLSVVLSAGIEVAQLLPALHRQATVGDVVSNGLGGLVGAAGASLWLHRARRHDERRRMTSSGSS